MEGRNTMNSIELKTLGELSQYSFYIPAYQRGYRWTEQQVLDLLNDIKEFIDRKPSDHEIYCLQPLVVQKRNENTFQKIKEEAKTSSFFYFFNILNALKSILKFFLFSVNTLYYINIKSFYFLF